MSWSWYLYTTCSAPEVVRVEAEYELALAAHLAEHDIDDTLSEASAGGHPPPRPDDIAAYRARFGETVTPELLERLAACRATLAFNYVGALDDSPLQVSALRFFLERLAPCVFDEGEFSLALGEAMLARLAGAPSRGRLDAALFVRARPTRKRKQRMERPGEVRAIRILQQLELAQHDADVALDLQRSVAKLPEPARRYLALLVREGARSYAEAAKQLGVTVDVLQSVIAEIEAALRT